MAHVLARVLLHLKLRLFRLVLLLHWFLLLLGLLNLDLPLLGHFRHDFLDVLLQLVVLLLKFVQQFSVHFRSLVAVIIPSVALALEHFAA